MNAVESLGQRLLINQWNGMKARLEKLGQHVIRPDDGFRIFNFMANDPRTPADQAGYSIEPVVFQVPERADGSPNMFVVVRGRIYLDRAALKADKVLRTTNFGTEVGYFRLKQDQLNHVYGAHYDFSLNEIGHPIFHGQMRSFNAYGASVSEQYDGIAGDSLDHMDKVLRTVRLPTAQMDFFGVVLQIAADHLLSKGSSDDQKVAFDELCEISRSVQGAAFRWPELEQAGSCMRARHWYPDRHRTAAQV